MMIDLHLLSKIAGSDFAFRQGMCSKIIRKSQSFVADFKADMELENYHAAYYRLAHFQSSSSSYCNLNFINFLSQMKFKLKTASCELQSKGTCLETIERVERGVDALIQRFPDDALRVA